jgi:hypothetical protein
MGVFLFCFSLRNIAAALNDKVHLVVDFGRGLKQQANPCYACLTQSYYQRFLMFPLVVRTRKVVVMTFSLVAMEVPRLSLASLMML